MTSCSLRGQRGSSRSTRRAIRCLPARLSLSPFSWSLGPGGVFPSAGFEAWWQSVERQPWRQRAMFSTYTYRRVRVFSEHMLGIRKGFRCCRQQNPQLRSQTHEVRLTTPFWSLVEMVYTFTSHHGHVLHISERFVAGENAHLLAAVHSLNQEVL